MSDDQQQVASMMQNLASRQSVTPGIDEIEILDQTDLLDSEMLAINKVYTKLGESIHAHRELGSFQREVRERFAEIGIVARCDFYESEHEDHLPKGERTKYPDITLVRRCEPTGEFDHDQMKHEVRSNIRGLNKQGNVQAPQVAPGFESRKSGLVVPKGK